MMEIVYKDEAYKIIGAAMEVHTVLGCGFLESVYQEALAIEFGKRKIDFLEEYPIEITYKGIVLKKQFIADFLCFSKIIVEIKSVSALAKEHESQIINYLHASGCRVGLLINFGENSLKYKRFVV